MTDGVRIGPVTPPQDVLDYFRGKTLRAGWSWLDVWGQEHAHAFTVAKATDSDVLAAFRGTIDEAITKGLDYKEWRDNLEPKLKSLGWWGPRRVKDDVSGKTARVDFSSPRRLQTIFWSNMRSARAAGQWQRAQATKDVLPYLIYNHTTAQDPRKEHLAFVGTLLPIDHAFWSTHFPPNGWGCKCSVRQVGRAEARRLGGVSADPTVETVAFVNRRTGEQTAVPVGIDPGWHTNPGESRARGLGRVLAGKIDRIPDRGLSNATIDGITGSDQFERMVTRPQKVPPKPARSDTLPSPIPPVPKPPPLELPVVQLPARPAGATTSVALLSTETAAKQQRRHPEVTPEVYREVLPRIVDAGEHVAAGRTTHIMAEIGAHWWHAVLKVTAAGDAIYLTSLYSVGAKKLKAVWRRIRAEADGADNERTDKEKEGR